MRDYELVLIISPNVAEEDIPKTVDRVTEFVTAHGGTVKGVDHWGRRKLAYHIKRFAEGHYVVAQFEVDPQVTDELESNLRISEEVLRHLLVRVNE